MSNQRREQGRRVRRGRYLGVESLEDRQLLASGAWPSLSPLIRQADQGQDTSRATINVMLKSLQTQLTNGPLADLRSGAVTGDGFMTEVQDLVASYDQDVDQQLLPRFVNVDEMLKLQGLRMVDTMASLNQANTVGLSTFTDMVTQAQTAIASLTKGPIYSLGTPLSGYTITTQAFENSLRGLAQNVGSSGLSLGDADANATLQSAAEAYRSTMLTGLLIINTPYATQVNTAVDTLELAANEIFSSGSTTVAADLSRAITAFDTAILDTSGLFGPNGYAGLANSTHGYLPHQIGTGRTASVFTDVGGTANVGGTATLTATLNSAAGTPIGGQTVNFLLDGVYAGAAVTDSSGVAKLGGVPTSASAGSTTGSVTVSFAGSASDRTSTGTGDLVVGQAATSLSTVGGTATFGGKATLTATLLSSETNAGIAGQTVNFTLDGTSVGSATTNSSGVATLSNVTTTATGGTHAGSVVASFAGTTDFAAAPSVSGNLVVSPAATTTTLTSSTNPSAFGQATTLTATVTSTTSGIGTPTGTVNFLDGTTILGNGTLNGSGVATFNASGLSVGTHSITAVYQTDGNFATSTSSVVSQVVNKANTSLGSVSNSPAITGNTTTTLTATLTNTSISAPVAAGQTVAFTVTHSGSTVATGSGTTNASGIATATISTSALTVGDIITASFVGNTNYNAAASATGTIV